MKVSLLETLPCNYVYFLQKHRLAQWRYKENNIDIKIKSELGKKKHDVNRNEKSSSKTT